MFFKKLAAVALGVVASLAASALVIGALNSENHFLSFAGAGIMLTAFGSLLIYGIYVAVEIGRELVRQIFGWFL